MRSLLFAGSVAVAALGLACTGPDRVFAEGAGAAGPGGTGGSPTSSSGGGDGGAGGNGGDGGQSSTLEVVVPPDRAVLREGSSVVVEVGVVRTGTASDPTVVTVGGLPTGVTADPLEIAPPATTGNLTLHAASGALLGLASVIVTGSAGALEDTASLDLIVAGAAGTPDETFVDATGTYQTQIGGLGTRGRGLVIQPDGKIVVTGFTTGSPLQTVTIRLTEGGVNDAGFGANGIVSVGIGGGSGGMTVAIEGSGRLLVGGFGNVDFDGNSALAILALQPDGSLDDTFGLGGSVTSSPGTGYATARAVLPTPADIVAIGEHTNAVNVTTAILYGYDLLGAQTGFHDDGEETLQAAGRQADGKLLFAGGIFSEFFLKRFLDVSTPDPAFGGAGTAFVNFNGRKSLATGLALLAGGQILLGGVSEDMANLDPRVAFARLNSNGSSDVSYGTGGTVLSNVPLRTRAAGSMVLDSQGRMLFGGYVGDAARQPAIARFLPDGTPDATFGPDGNGYVVLSQFPADANGALGVWGIAVDDLDRVVVAGEVGPDASPSLFAARYWF